VVGLKSVLNLSSVIREVQYHRLVFPWMDTIQTGKRLHGMHTSELHIDLHRMEKRLVKPGLELIGHTQ
jgi:hypothetical protein